MIACNFKTHICRNAEVLRLRGGCLLDVVWGDSILTETIRRVSRTGMKRQYSIRYKEKLAAHVKQLVWMGRCPHSGICAWIFPAPYIFQVILKNWWYCITWMSTLLNTYSCSVGLLAVF